MYAFTKKMVEFCRSYLSTTEQNLSSTKLPNKETTKKTNFAAFFILLVEIERSISVIQILIGLCYNPDECQMKETVLEDSVNCLLNLFFRLEQSLLCLKFDFEHLL